MNLILILGQNNALSYHGRRLSQDRELSDRLKTLVNNATVYMNQKSYDLYNDISISSQVIQKNIKYTDNDFILIENEDLPLNISKINRIIIFRWDNVYPADRFFNINNFNLYNYKQECNEEFQGFSHKKITMEIWTK